MKKQMLMLLALAAMAGCSKSEVVDDITTGSEGTPIVLKTFVGKATKAADLKLADLQTDGFNMVAYQTSEAKFPGTTAPTSFIPLTKVSYSSAWSYTGTQYWPAKNVSFFAAAPISEVSTLTAATANTWPTFDYTVKTTAAEQKDVVVASFVDKNVENNPTGAVSFNFTHALSQIGFKAAGDDANLTYEVTNITLSGLAGSGTYTYGAPGSWTPSSTKDATYTFAPSTGTVTGTTAAELSNATTGNLMLIPQTLEEATAKYTATFTVKEGGNVIATVTTLPQALPAKTWKAGTKYVYTLTLSAGLTNVTISNPTFGGWGDEQ